MSRKETNPDGFSVVFSPRARDHLKDFRRRDQQIIVDAIAIKLTTGPDEPTRQKKKLEDNELAPWELRVGDFRVFYDIDSENNAVIIIAIGRKDHNVLRIAGEEIDL